MTPVLTNRRYAIALAAIVIFALLRVASTHRVFSEVLDEPAHLAAGFEWLHGSYKLDASHPPLARILGALPLWIAGFPTPTHEHFVTSGNELLYHGDRYVKTLARVRIGNLLLLAIAIIATAEWARRAFSKTVALIAAALMTTLPPVLGHAGVLTTDLAPLAAIPLALLALETRHPALIGAAIGFGLLTKFSFLVFFLPCALLAIWLRGIRFKPWLAIAIAFLIFWAGYRFDLRTPRAYNPHHAEFVFETAAPAPLRSFARWSATHVPLPAPAFAVGLGMLQAHNKEGHRAYLLGRTSNDGWWYYFPVVFFYKTPLPFLLLALWGALQLRGRAQLAYLFCAIAIMAASMTSAINIGVRHILPIYAPLAIVAAFGIVEIAKRAHDTFGRVALSALCAWLFIGVALAHPNYLAWFNEAAQPNPARVAVDSNLDWGQDSLRLERAIHELRIEHLFIDLATNVRLDKFGIPIEGFDPHVRPSGWVAISETPLALRAQEYAWLRTYRPVRRIGDSIRLYKLP